MTPEQEGILLRMLADVNPEARKEWDKYPRLWQEFHYATTQASAAYYDRLCTLFPGRIDSGAHKALLTEYLGRLYLQDAEVLYGMRKDVE